MVDNIYDSLDRLKESFLYAAAQGGNTEDCVSLIEIGAEINFKSPDGDTPLLAATRRGHTDTIEALVVYGADVNIAGADSYAPVHIAAQKGDMKIIDIFLSANANITIRFDHAILKVILLLYPF